MTARGEHCQQIHFGLSYEYPRWKVLANFDWSVSLHLQEVTLPGMSFVQGKDLPWILLPICSGMLPSAFEPPLPGQSMYPPGFALETSSWWMELDGWGMEGEENLGHLWWVSVLPSDQVPCCASSWDGWSIRTAVPGYKLHLNLR